MKKYFLGVLTALIIPAFAATVIWPNATWLETFQNGFLFGNGTILSALNGVITFEDKRLDDGSRDIVVQEDYEGASTSWTCDANLTKADDSSTPLNGSTSVTFTQGATPPAANAKCTGPTYTLPLKAQTKNEICVTFEATSDANDNEFALNIEGNTSGQLVQVLIPASTTAKQHKGCFETVGDTSLDFDIEVLTPNASTVLEIDDLEVTLGYQATEIYASSEWQSFTPSCTHTTNADSSNSLWKRDGDDMLIRYRIAYSGATDAVNLECDLPSGFAIDTNKLATASTHDGSLGRFNVWDSSLGDTDDGTLHYSDSNSLLFYITLVNITYTQVTNVTNTTPTTLGSGDAIYGFARVPIAGWTDTTKGVVVKNVEKSDIANTNVFSAKITNNGTAAVSSENLDWISSVTRSAPGTVDITLNSGVFSVAPSVKVSPSSGSDRIASVVSVSTSTIQVRTEEVSAGVNTDYDFDIIVSKQGPDFVTESQKVYTVPLADREAESFLAPFQINFWDAATDTDEWDTSLLSPSISTSKYLEINNVSGQERITNKFGEKIEIQVTASCAPDLNGALTIKDSSGNQFSQSQADIAGGYAHNASGSFVLNVGDYFYIQCSDPEANRAGGISITAKPANVEAINFGRGGERVEANQTANAPTVTNDTFVDMTGASLSLTAGRWEICYAGLVFHDWVSGTNVGSQCQWAIRDGSNNVVSRSQTLTYELMSTSNDERYHQHFMCAEVSITSDTTYKLSVKSSVSNTSAFCQTYSSDNNLTGAITDPDQSTKIWANRIR